MKDTSSRAKIGTLHPAVRERFTAFIDDVETSFLVTVRIVQPYRTFPEQQAIYDQGRSKPGKIVTWAKPGSSYHNYGLAADLCPLKEDHSDLDWNYDFSKWKALADKHELTWGGDFPAGKKDPDHYEFKAGYTWQQLLKKYLAKDFIAGTEYVNL